MNIDANLLLSIGIGLVAFGTLILFLGGMKKKLSVSEYMNLGREMLLNLDEYFKRSSILIAKLFWYTGILIVWVALFLVLYRGVSGH